MLAKKEELDKDLILRLDEMFKNERWSSQEDDTKLLIITENHLE